MYSKRLSVSLQRQPLCRAAILSSLLSTTLSLFCPSVSAQELPLDITRLRGREISAPQLFVPPVKTGMVQPSVRRAVPQQAPQPQAVYPKPGTLYGYVGQPLFMRLECTPTSAGSAFPATASGKVRLTSALRAVPAPSNIIQYYQDYQENVGTTGGPSVTKTLSIICRNQQAGPRLGIYTDDPLIGGVPVPPHSVIPAKPAVVPVKPDSSCGGSSNEAADPILTDTGVFVHSHCDLKVTGGRVPFRFTRSHRTLDLFVANNSLFYNLGPFGFSSSHNYDWYIQSVSATTLQVKMPDNARYDFVLNASGDFVNTGSPNWIGTTLRLVSGGYSLRFKDGTIYSFNAEGFLIAQADRNGNTVTISRDIDNALVQISSVSGTLDFETSRVSTTDGSQYTERIESVTDQDGRKVFYLYDTSSRLVEVRLADDTPTQPNRLTYTYDASLFGFMKTGTDGRGIVYFNNTYDLGFGRVTRQNQPEGRIFDFTYITDASGAVVLSTDIKLPNTQTYRQNFNAGQYTTDLRDELQQVYPVNRDPLTNQVLSLSDPLARQVSVQYDSAGNLKKVTAPLNNITEVTYEPVYNLPVQLKNALNNVSTVSYDTKGNPLRVADPLSHGVTMTYDSFGQMLTSKNDVDGSMAYEYDGRGRLTKTTAPLGKIRSYAYDNLNRVTLVTDELGRNTSYAYDLMNRLTKVTFADSAFMTMEYDQDSNLKTLTDERGNATRYEYDMMNRLTKRTNPLGQFETYTYGTNNQVSTHTDRLGRLHKFFYDVRDNLQRSELSDGTVITYTYDAVNRLKSVVDSRDGTVSWEYDDLDRVIKETTSQSGDVLYTYDTLGRRTTLGAASGYSVTYTYDTANRLGKISRSSLDYLLGYDNANRLNRIQMPNGVVGSSIFDTAGRLSQILYQKGTTTLKSLQYSFDVADQLKQITGVSASLAVDSAVTSTSLNTNNQYLNVNGNNLLHDQDGNLTTNAQTTYQWDVRDRLIGLSGPGVTASFSYDALGRRRAKTINGATTTFQYDGADILRDSTASYLHGPGIDDVLSRTITSGNEYFLKDHLGSTIALTDPSGNLSTQYAYSAYGKATITGSSTNYFTYTGREDDGTGLYFYRARYYSPDLKRFVAEDPIGFAGGQSNLYGYVGGNPISFTDPSGLRSYIIPGAIGYGGGNIQKNITSMGGTNNTPLADPKSVVNIDPYSNPIQFIPITAGSDAGQRIKEDLEARPLQPGEQLNIFAYSNGNVALPGALLKILGSPALGADNPINIILLDPSPLPVPKICGVNVYTILSNNPNSTKPFPNGDIDRNNANYKLPDPTRGFRDSDGTSHTALSAHNGWIQWLRTKGVRF
jgi:RHS repeat-associated protein